MMTSPLVSYSQPGTPKDPDAPISGIEILVSVGVLIGLRKALCPDRKQTKNRMS